MEDLDQVDPMIRIAIFSRARTLADRVSDRLKDAKSFLEKDDEDGVLGSLEGVESDLQAISCLMFMCHEFKEKEHDE